MDIIVPVAGVLPSALVDEPPAGGVCATPETEGLPSFALPDVEPLVLGPFEPLVPFEPFEEEVDPFGVEFVELEPELCPGKPENAGTLLLLSELDEQPAATSASKTPKFADRHLSCL